MTLPRLTRRHLRRLRDLWRSAGWPYQDTLELELLAWGLLERLTSVNPAHRPDTLRLTEAGIRCLAHGLASNRQALDAHEALVQRTADHLAQCGRITWTGLSLHAKGEAGAWALCKPDVFSIRSTSAEALLEPSVHEIKVSRADLLGDLKQADKRARYLDAGGQCWYVLGCNARGEPIADPSEIPPQCGVMIDTPAQLSIARPAPRQAARPLAFHIWMALARARPREPGEPARTRALGEPSPEQAVAPTG